MNERDQKICKAILSHLDKLDGGQSIETLMHAAARLSLINEGEPAPSLKEFEACLLVCDQRGWVIGVPAKITKQMKWSLSDVGKAALMEF